MATMNVSIPDEMKTWVESRTGRGTYANASDYVRDLVRQDRKRQESIEEFRALVDEGFASVIETMTMDDIWDLAADRARKPVGT